ncbi:MAG: MFS transporter [Mailhella sp.]|nr:MFS transporter [Mailhella sp.]
MSIFQRYYPSTLAPDLRAAFDLDAVSFSLISSATMLGYAITQIPSGIFADVFGGRRTLAVYQTLAGVFGIVFAFSDSFSSAVACRFLIGLTLASNVPSYKILALAVPAHRFALCSSILSAFGRFGSLLAAAPLIALTQMTGWRMVLACAGIFTVGLGVSVWLFVPDLDRLRSGAREGSSLRERILAVKDGIRMALRNRNFWLILIWFNFIIGNGYIMGTTWWGSFFMQAHSLSKESTGLALSLFALIPLPFMLVFPWLSQTVLRSRKKLLILVAAGQLCVSCVFCLCRETALSFPVLTGFGALFGLLASCSVPIAFTMVKESVASSVQATATAVVNSGAPVFAAVMQGVFGVILKAGMERGARPLEAYADAFLLIAAGAGIALVCAVFMKDTFSK